MAVSDHLRLHAKPFEPMRQDSLIGLIVFSDQHTLSRKITARFIPRLGGCIQERSCFNREVKSTSLRDFAFEPNPTAHKFRQPVANRKPQACPPELTSG